MGLLRRLLSRLQEEFITITFQNPKRVTLRFTLLRHGPSYCANLRIGWPGIEPRGAFLEGPEKVFAPGKPYNKILNVVITELFYSEVFFKQEVSGVYTSLFLDTDDLEMALGARKVSGAFEKRAPCQGHSVVFS